MVCSLPAYTPRTQEHPWEQKAGKVLAGEGWKTSMLDILVLFTHFPTVSLHGAWGQTMVPANRVTPLLQAGKGHLQVCSTEGSWHCSLQSPPATLAWDGDTWVPGIASFPYSHRIGFDFDLLGRRGHQLVENLQVGFETEGTTNVLWFCQTGGTLQHWGLSVEPTPSRGTHRSSQSRFPFHRPCVSG